MKSTDIINIDRITNLKNILLVSSSIFSIILLASYNQHKKKLCFFHKLTSHNQRKQKIIRQIKLATKLIFGKILYFLQDFKLFNGKRPKE